MPFGAFNYSKMTKYRFLIDSNIFWMDFGTSKILTFFGPVVDPWTFYLLSNYFKKYKTNMGTSLKNINSSYLTEFMNSWIHGFMNSWIHEFMNSWIPESMNPWIHEFMNSWIHEFPITNQHTDSHPCIRSGRARSLIETNMRCLYKFLFS